MAVFHDRMLEDLELRNLKPSTRRQYLIGMRRLVAHYMRPPTELGPRDIQCFLLHLLRVKNLKPTSLKLYVASITFFYTHTLRRPEIVAELRYPKVGKPLP